MTELLTAAQMRAIEQAAIESGEVTGLELMERAGAGVVEAIFEEWPELAKTTHRAVVLCGPGNNGGDGFVVARLLHEWGWEVEVFLYGDEAKLPPDAKVNCERWRVLGEIEPLINWSRSKKISPKNKTKVKWSTPNVDDWCEAVVIDAVFGTGLSRAIDEKLREVFWGMSVYLDSTVKIVAVDIPTGLSSESGRYLDFTKEEFEQYLESIEFENAVDLTVTFHRKKVGHILASAQQSCGKCVVKEIGIEKWSDPLKRISKQERLKIIRDVELFDEVYSEFVNLNDALDLFSLRKTLNTNKYSHGHAYILSGPSSKTGAARLAARGALRIGAGVVTVACPPDAVVEHAAQLTAIMLTPVADANALTAVLGDERINAICVGPALGLDQDRVDVLAAVLQAKRATVIDADGLTLISQNKDLFDLLHKDCVLTPHAGEFARVFPDIAVKLNATPAKGPAYSKVDATREAANRAGCVVLFKGADTVIADPDGCCAINSAHYERATPWLATAGSGDVLAGFITGLLARGFAPMQAAETAAWLHVECALKFGPGLISEDIAEQLPEVFRDLGL